MSAQSGRLQHALKHLREQWDIAQDTWDDPASRDFEKNHLSRSNKTPRTRSSAWRSSRRSWGRSGLSARKTDRYCPDRGRIVAIRQLFVASLACDSLNNGPWNHA